MNLGFSLKRFGAVLYKEFIQMRRDRITFGMMIGLPIIQLFLFGFAINADPRNLPTLVEMGDNGPLSRAVIAGMQNSSYFAFKGAVSGIGDDSGSPYVAAVEENTRRGVPWAFMASSRRREVTTLPSQYFAGSVIDSPTSDFAAKCSTPSKPSPSTSAATAAASPSMKRASGCTASACPVDRSSTTVTW